MDTSVRRGTGLQITAVNATMPVLQDQLPSTSLGRAPPSPTARCGYAAMASSQLVDQVSLYIGLVATALGCPPSKPSTSGELLGPKIDVLLKDTLEDPDVLVGRAATRGLTAFHCSRRGPSVPWTTPSLSSFHLLRNHRLLRCHCGILDFSKLVDTF